MKRFLLEHGWACFQTSGHQTKTKVPSPSPSSPGAPLPGAASAANSGSATSIIDPMGPGDPGASMPGVASAVSSGSSIKAPVEFDDPGVSMPRGGMPQQIVAPCLMHACDGDGLCPVAVAQNQNQITMEVAGATCVAFSPLGKREGLAHKSMRDFHVWAASTRLMEPTIILFECARHFPKEELDFWFSDKYRMEMLPLAGPSLLGWPVTRDRLYCLMFLRSQVTFLGSEADYNQLFRKHTVATGDVFFSCCPGDAEYTEAVMMFRKRRHLPALPGASSPGQGASQAVDWPALYCPGARRRLAEYDIIRQQRQAGVSCGPIGDDSFIADLEQNPGQGARCGPWLPCVVRHGTLYSWKHKRHAFPVEVMAAQGVPLLKELQVAAGGLEPSWQETAKKLSASKLLSLAGNGMHAPTVASLMGYALANIVLVPSPVLRFSSWLIEDGQLEAEGSTAEAAEPV